MSEQTTPNVPRSPAKVAVPYDGRSRKDLGAPVDVVLDLETDTVVIFDEEGDPIASLDREDFNASYRLVDATELSVGPYRDFKSKLKATRPAWPPPPEVTQPNIMEVAAAVQAGIASGPDAPPPVVMADIPSDHDNS